MVECFEVKTYSGVKQPILNNRTFHATYYVNIYEVKRNIKTGSKFLRSKKSSILIISITCHLYIYFKTKKPRNRFK